MMGGKWYEYIGAALLGAGLCFAIMFFANRGATEKLRSDLAGVRTALVNAGYAGTDLAAGVRIIHSQLVRSNSLVAEQQRELDANKSELAGQQRTINQQKLVIDAQKRGLAKLAGDLSAAGGDIGKKLRAFAEGFRRLYAIYHPGGK